MTQAVCTALPFAGLGFDLAPVEARARLLVLRRTRVSGSRTAHCVGADVHRPSGYGLLVRLSREVRGR